MIPRLASSLWCSCLSLLDAVITPAAMASYKEYLHMLFQIILVGGGGELSLN